MCTYELLLEMIMKNILVLVNLFSLIIILVVGVVASYEAQG